MDLPQAPTRFGVSATGLLGETDRLIKGACALYAQIVESISPEKANFANTISPIAQIENKLISAKKLFGFYNSTSTSSELREASARASVLFNKFESETLMRDDLFRLVNIVVCNQRKENLSSEDAYYLENKHQSFLRNGLGIQNEEQTARFTQVQTLLREQTLKAQRCINKSHGLWLSSDELKGFLKSSLSTLKKDEGENETQLWFPLTRGQIVKALQFVEKESTRRKIYVANDNRCLENVSTLKEIILLRDESARLLGFFSFMDLSILDKMANSADLIANYVSELRSALRTAGQRETQDLLELKKKDQRNDPDASSEMDTKFYLWDHNFYKTILTKARTNFNEERFSEYFPLEQTLTGIMDIYSTLFGLRFVKISTGKFPLFGNDHVMIWHEDVSIYSVWSNESQGSDFLGYLYLDLFPRENKYNHAGHYGLIPVSSVFFI
jgi:metallopeptidase MepB